MWPFLLGPQPDGERGWLPRLSKPRFPVGVSGQEGRQREDTPRGWELLRCLPDCRPQEALLVPGRSYAWSSAVSGAGAKVNAAHRGPLASLQSLQQAPGVPTLGLLDFSWVLNFPAWKQWSGSFPSDGKQPAAPADQERGSGATDQAWGSCGSCGFCGQAPACAFKRRRSTSPLCPTFQAQPGPFALQSPFTPHDPRTRLHRKNR